MSAYSDQCGIIKGSPVEAVKKNIGGDLTELSQVYQVGWAYIHPRGVEAVAIRKEDELF